MRANPKCPCLRQTIVTICSADTDAVRIPARDYVARVCLTEQHRRCEILRGFVGLRLASRAGDGRDTDERRASYAGKR